MAQEFNSPFSPFGAPQPEEKLMYPEQGMQSGGTGNTLLGTQPTDGGVDPTVLAGLGLGGGFVAAGTGGQATTSQVLSPMAQEELEAERLRLQAEASTNPIMQPTDLIGQQAPQEDVNPLSLADAMRPYETGDPYMSGEAYSRQKEFDSMFGVNQTDRFNKFAENALGPRVGPGGGIIKQAGNPTLASEVLPFGLGMGTGNQPYVANTDRGIQRGASNNILGMDQVTKVTDDMSAQMGVPMTGMRQLNSETGQPASQMLLDAALRSGVALPQASVPINAVETPQPQATNQPSTYPLGVTVGGQQIPTTPQPAAGSPQAFFEQYRAEGPLSQEQIASGEAEALRMGTTFDPDTGFSRDNFLLGQQVPSMPKAPMGVDETRARLGGRTLNEYLNAPRGTEGVSGLRTDPQGRMIPAGFETRADAYGDYERESAAREARLAARMQQPGETITERDTRVAAGRTQSSRNVPTDVREAMLTPEGRRTAKQINRLARWSGSTQGQEMGGVAGLEQSLQPVDAQQQKYDALRIEKLGMEISDLRKGEPSEVAQAESQADELGLTGEDRQSFIIGEVAGPGVVDRILGKSPTDTKVPTSIIEAKERRSQLAEARKLFAAGKINESADILASIGMVNKLTGFPIMPSEYFKGVTPPPPPGDTGSEEPIEDVIARNS